MYPEDEHDDTYCGSCHAFVGIIASSGRDIFLKVNNYSTHGDVKAYQRRSLH